MRIWALGTIILTTLALLACSSHPISDPLGIDDAIGRCMDLAAKGQKADGFAPIPFLACR